MASILAQRHEREVLIAELAALNWVIQREGKMQELAEEFRGWLVPDLRSRFDAAMATPTEGRRAFLARHPILAAIRYLLLNDAGGSPDEGIPSGVVAVLLAHAVASELHGSDEETAEKVLHHPAHLVLEVTRSALLYQSEDVYASIDRTVRLWRDFGNRLVRYSPRRPPTDLLAEAAGLDLEHLLALGFLLFAFSDRWEPGKPPFMRADLGSGMDPERIAAFVALVSATEDEYRAGKAGYRRTRRPEIPVGEKIVTYKPGSAVEPVTACLR